MVSYFIYYEFVKNGASGNGNVDVELKVPITEIKQIRFLEKELLGMYDCDSLMISNYIKLN